MRLRRTLTFSAVLLSLSILTPVLGEQTAQQIVQDANRLLAEGSYSEAARAYGEAIELEPSYSNYYKRATAYLSMGRQAAAIDDFDTILKLNPAFVQAHFQKAKIYAKQGDFDTAEAELKAFGKTKADPAAEGLVEAVKTAVSEKKSARKAADKKQWEACVQHSSRALETGPSSVELRELRVECATEMGDLDTTYADLTRLSALNPSDISLSLRLSQISYFLLGSSTATSHIKQCLHYDPESKPCKKVHKLLRSLEKDTAKARNFAEGSTWRQALKILDGPDGLLARFEQALEDASTSSDGKPAILPKQFNPSDNSQMRLELYALACKSAVGANDLKKDKGQKWCDEVLRMDENNQDALVGQGERLMKEEQWEEAIRMFERAFEQSNRSSQDIANRLQKAQKLLKVSKQKNYYKVLGVPRDADDRAIKKAFRKAAKVAHPDVGGSEEKMAALNEAYEVLSNDELRQRYDNGDDPNDPGGGRGGNPFAHHGGVPFQFFQQAGGFGQSGGFPFPGGQGGGGGGRKFQFHFGG